MNINLSMIHYTFITFMLLVLVFMIRKRDTSLICIIGIFLLGLISTKSIHMSAIGIFDSFIFAINELISTILIISIMVAMSNVLAKTGISEIMVSPLLKFIKNENIAYWTIGVIMMMVSWFFWPSPAAALVGAALIPVAIKAKLPKMGVAIAMNLFGHGIALSSDFIIQAAPKIAADAAGLSVDKVTQASIPLIITMGLVTTITAFIMLKKDLKKNSYDNEDYQENIYESDNNKNEKHLPLNMRKVLGVLITFLFLIDIYIMIKHGLQGGIATALIGGTAVFILIVLSLLQHKNKGLEAITEYFIEGLQFGFKIFGVVIPIAAFFYLGDGGFVEIFGEYLPSGSYGIVNDIGVAISHSVPLNKVSGAIMTTFLGIITGLDGSGFSGLSLIGSVSKIFSLSIDTDGSTLTALGQIATIWVGGGTIIPWALIPIAAICNVDPFELARKNLIPVSLGLVVTTVVAIVLI